MKALTLRVGAFFSIGRGRAAAEVAGMMEQNLVAQSGAVEMNVDLCGCDAIVAEHLLDCAEIGSAFEEVGGE